MARCLLCLLLLAVHTATGSLETGFAVHFKIDEGHESVHVRDRGTGTCGLNQPLSETVQLHEHDILVISIAQDFPRSCLVNSTAFPEPFNLDNDTNFARLALEGWAVNVTTGNTPINISVACSGSHMTTTVRLTTSNAPGNQMEQCCVGPYPQHHWCHRCGKGQYREGLECRPCPGSKTTPMTGVFTKDKCTCPEGYGNTTDECPKCTEKYFSVIQDGQNQDCQPCDTAQLVTGQRATFCPATTPDPTDTTVKIYPATQYLRPRQKKCGQECCVPGEYWDAGLQQCQNCVDGYNYSDTRGATTCKDCEKPGDGKENVGCFDGPGKTLPCKEGYYRSRPDPNFFCTACEPRKTTRSSGSMNEDYCLCAEGYSVNDQGGCEACEVGSYKEDIEDSQCNPCPQHKTTRSTGSTTIMDCVCKRGFYGENGAAVCSRCERKQYQDELGRDTCEACEICPYGGYATGCGGANKGRCLDCIDVNCQGAADGERCDFCGICNYNKTYSHEILGLEKWFNSTVDKCGVCGGNITEEREYETCHKCPAGTTGEDGPRVCNETERNRGDDVQYEDIVDASQCRVCEPCATGTFKNISGDDTCQLCPKGKYANVQGLTACYDCEANKTTASTGSTEVEYCHCEPGFYHNHTNGTDDHQCFRCEPGFFSEALNHHVCNDCEAGKYNHHMVVHVSNTCLSCARDTWSERGAAECIECEHSITDEESSSSILDCKCNPGYMNSPNGKGICIPCDPGGYSEGYSNDQCESCQAGKYSNVTAATSNATCTSCDAGTVAPPGASACELCPAGKYADATDTGECTKCPAGKYSTTVAASNQTACIDCPDDSSSPAGSGAVSACVCNQGYNGSAGKQCTACEAGQYSSALDENNNRDCISCPSNSSSRPGSDVLTDCTCNDGYSGSDGDACSLCAADTYSSYDSNTMQATCESCPSNSTSNIGSYRFLDCECNAGYSGLGGTGSVCSPCVEGKYKASNSGIACTDCFAGKYSDSVGSSICTDCAAGKFSIATRTSCDACAAGQSSQERSVSSTDCYDCPAGKYEGGIQGQQPNICVSCHVGTYSDTAGRTTCEYCGVRRDAPAGSTSISDCSEECDYDYYPFYRYPPENYAGKRQFCQYVPCCTPSRGTCGYDCSCFPNC